MARTRDKGVKRRIGAEARRAQILRVAGDMFTKDGIDATSMRKIARKAGVSTALLYKHFADKDALLLAIGDGFFEKLMRYMDKAVDGVTDPVKRLRIAMQTYVACGLENPREYHLTFMTALPRLRRVSEMKAFRERARRGETIPADDVMMGMRAFARLEQAVADVVATKRTRQKDVAAIAEVVWSAGHGLVSLMITHENFGFTETRRLVDMSIEVMLGGLLKD
jgi:AcrR family transcriptional regulator